MSLTFDQARKLIPEPTMSHGYEDSEDFNILLAEPDWDQVTLVNKATQTVRREVYFQVLDKLEKMTKVEDK